LSGIVRAKETKRGETGGMEDGAVTRPEAGSPQGVVSPLLANVYLHYVLGEWFVREVRPRLRDRAYVVRYADDFVVGFTDDEDARRVMAVLPKRFGKYGLTIHPDKTRLVPFRKPHGEWKPPRPFWDSRTLGRDPGKAHGC
jgi:RNA-directed DNA polymerase